MVSDAGVALAAALGTGGDDWGWQMVVEGAVLLLSTQGGLDRRAEMPLWLASLF
jgi:hypothetical protein